jgi:hypothetical protein
MLKFSSADVTGRYKDFAPKFHGRYLSSNVNITVFDDQNNVVSVPIGSASCPICFKHSFSVLRVYVMQAVLPNSTPQSTVSGFMTFIQVIELR